MIHLFLYYTCLSISLKRSSSGYPDSKAKRMSSSASGYAFNENSTADLFAKAKDKSRLFPVSRSQGALITACNISLIRNFCWLGLLLIL